MNYTFESDNAAGVHPKVLESLSRVNVGSSPMYGADPVSEAAASDFREKVGENSSIYFVFGGTGANVLGLSTMLKPHQAVICAESAHIHQDEAGAPERFTGSKLLPIAHEHGKIRPAEIEPVLSCFGDQHHVQPKVISISQPTEYGAVYTDHELKQLADYAHGKFMYLHVDGARIANAEVSIQASFRVRRLGYSGVDVLSFGNTKNGMMYGEAIVFFRPELADSFQWVRKQGMQLPAKMRYVAAQCRTMFEGDLWLENASSANCSAIRLAEAINEIDYQIKIMRPVQTNAVFARFPRAMIKWLQKEYAFYVWDGDEEVRLMTSWMTTEDDIADFVEYLKRFPRV